MKGDSKMSKKKNTMSTMPEKQTEEQTIPVSEKEKPEGCSDIPQAEEEQDPVQKALDEANAKTAEYLAMAQRVQADFENYRKRNESIRAEAYSDGRKDTATMMLPVLDNLERAVDAADACSDNALKSGVEMVLKQMRDIYCKMEVKPIDRIGEKFDPNLENAIMQGTADEGEPGTVCQVLQKGYMIGDKVMRHAMVKVVPE